MNLSSPPRTLVRRQDNYEQHMFFCAAGEDCLFAFGTRYCSDEGSYGCNKGLQSDCALVLDTLPLSKEQQGVILLLACLMRVISNCLHIPKLEFRQAAILPVVHH